MIYKNSNTVLQLSKPIVVIVNKNEFGKRKTQKPREKANTVGYNSCKDN